MDAATSGGHKLDSTLQGVPFEGSAQQRRILKLREVEGPLERIRLVSSLLARDAESDDFDAVNFILEAADEALARLSEVER